MHRNANEHHVSRRNFFWVQQAQADAKASKQVARGTCQEGDKVKLIRFGQQGVSGSPRREGESKAAKARRASFKARHAKNIAKGKMSAAFWADKTKW